MKIRPAAARDACAITAIYAPYVRTTAISLEDEAPDLAEVERRIRAAGALHPWLVAELDGEIVGYAYAAAFRPRPGYRFTVETTLYVASDRQRCGVGRSLYGMLLDLLVQQGFGQAIAAISLPNDASIGIHEAFGFQQCGAYGQVGWKLGNWCDVGLWQRPLAPLSTPPREVLEWRPLLSADIAGATSRAG